MADQGKPQGILTTGPSQNPTIKVVAIISDALDLQDKKVICKAICYCEVNPNKGKKKETNQYQACVSERLGELDKFLNYQSPYKAEVNYDMHRNPPAPIMEKGIITKVHPYLPGWIKKYWEVEKGYSFEKGQGMVRRPDVVIVKDPNLPPIQDNIKHVIEIKFKDKLNRDQVKDYPKIAGGQSKVKKLDPDECDCGNDDENGKTSMVIEFVTWAAGLIAAAIQLRKGKLPKLPRFPSPKPSPQPAW
ncbi:VRR-NUC domain protein [Acinetobacter sp. Ag2]|uniref:VRR-NUC domain-containing protein n=1 Tax=Acinetobacter sp. Ag2 TaxID=1646532 RepID=UPI0006296282|nr:VRR-NUC domain-containing protein [Acinetobacter sp. Ag2]KKW77375.1 VRR-NUC domain protein [Acinetobacter sp. Ag2]